MASESSRLFEPGECGFKDARLTPSRIRPNPARGQVPSHSEPAGEVPLERSSSQSPAGHFVAVASVTTSNPPLSGQFGALLPCFRRFETAERGRAATSESLDISSKASQRRYVYMAGMAARF